MSHLLHSTFLVHPLETVHFGTPQSFAAGENHRAYSEFPPSPFAFQGMVRSQLLRAVEPPLDLDDWSRTARDTRAALVGVPEALPAGWQLQGPFPAQRLSPPDAEDGESPRIMPWLPAPRFLLRRADGRPPGIARPIHSPHPSLSDLGTQAPLLGLPYEHAAEPIRGWLSAENYLWALSGRGAWDGKQYADTLPPFVRRELRPGLGVDRQTATAQHALLYFLESLRFRVDAGFYGYFRGQVDERIPADALETGAGTAGRKGRPVAFQRVRRLHPAWVALLEGRYLPDAVEETAGFWLISVTPAHIPEPRAPQLHVTLPSGVQVHWHAALTGAPQMIGGYTMATGASRPNRFYIPAGSAWWCTLTGGDASQRAAALRLLHNTHFLGEPREAPFGFGHTLVGLGPPIEEARA